MNTLPESQATGPSSPLAQRSLVILGVGDAGSSVLERLGALESEGVSRLALNTDQVSLSRLPGVRSHALGRKLTRGLGCGGDAVQGATAAEADWPVLNEWVAETRMVWIVAGLAGGTGGGAAPVLARMAREKGALVLAYAILPFDFEGSQRREQSDVALTALRREADAVICLPNQGMARLFDEKPLFTEVYAAANDLIAQGIIGVWKTLQRPGMVPLGFGDFERLLRGRKASSTLATVETRGENRTREALDRVQSHPFLQAGPGLAEADAVLVSIAGGSDLRFDEVEWLHGQFQHLCERARVVPGTALDESLTGRVQLTVIVVRGGSRTPAAAPASLEAPPISAPGSPGLASTASAPETGLHFETMQDTGGPAPAITSAFIPAAPALSSDQMRRLAERQIKNPLKRKKAVQTLFNFDVVSLGRFAQTEPTLRNGENLDEPTWARRGIALN